MAATEASGEAAMLPGMIQMVMRVAAAGVVAHPFFTVVYVGSIRMSCLVVEAAVFLGRMRSGYARRTVCGNVLTAATDLGSASAFLAFVLSNSPQRKHETYHEQSNQLLHSVIALHER